MMLQVQCARCKKTERLDIDPDRNKGGIPQDNKLGIPMPNFSNNGLDTYSIAHSDHTLILDVDANGDVRGEKIIDRIDRGMEKTLAAIATKILELYILNDEKKNDAISFFFITQNKDIHKLLLGIFSNLIFNIPKGTQSISSVSHEESLFEFDNLTAYVGPWQKKIYNFRGDKMVAIYELDENSADQVKIYMKKDLENGITDTAIMFQSNYISTPEGKKTMAEIFKINSPQALDMSNQDRAAQTLFAIITSTLM